MKAKHLATFERKAPTLDHFIGEVDEWVEVTKAWIGLEPVQITAQMNEATEGAQVSGQRKVIARATWTPTLATLDSTCRMKLANVTPTVPSDLSDDRNYRIFYIEQLVNINENNRELQLLLMERT